MQSTVVGDRYHALGAGRGGGVWSSRQTLKLSADTAHQPGAEVVGVPVLFGRLLPASQCATHVRHFIANLQLPTPNLFSPSTCPVVRRCWLSLGCCWHHCPTLDPAQTFPGSDLVTSQAALDPTAIV